MQKPSVTVRRKSMSQGQGNHCCLFRSQSEWWLAAHRQGANSVVWLPCSRICLALKAGSPILLVYLEGLRVQGWQVHANLIRNRGLNQNINLLFSNKSCTSRVCSDLPTKALPSLRAYLWESQIIVGQSHRACGAPMGSLLMILTSDGFRPCAQRTRCDCRGGSSVCHTNSLTCDRVRATLPNWVFSRVCFCKDEIEAFCESKLTWWHCALLVAVTVLSLRFEALLVSWVFAVGSSSSSLTFWFSLLLSQSCSLIWFRG